MRPASDAARRTPSRGGVLSSPRARLTLVLAAGAAVFIWVFPEDWLLICLVAVLIGFILPRSMGGFGGGGFRL